jgi:type I restriction enzyme S subunit
MSDWIDLRIKNLFASSSPGDWGSEGSPETGVPVLRSTNFRNDGSIYFSDVAFRSIDDRRLDRRRVNTGTILIEKSGGSPTQAAGRVVYCGRDLNGTASNFIEVIKVRPDFDPRYVAYVLYYLYQIGLVLKYQQQTTGIINFKLNEYSEELIKSASFKPEQEKIAEILSTVDQAIEQTEALVAKQQRIKIGLMQDLLTRGIDENGNLRTESTHKFKDSPLGRIPFDWNASKLALVGTWASGGTPPKANPNFWGDDIPWLCPKDMKTFDISVTTDGLTRTGARNGSREMPPRTVFIVVRGMILAHTFPVCITSVPMAFNQDVKGIVTTTNLDPRFFAYWLVSHGHDLLKVTTTATHGTKRFDMKDLFDVDIAVPDKDEQIRIVSRFDTLEADILATKKETTKLRLLKTALMQDLLTGKKRVTLLLEHIITH